MAWKDLHEDIADLFSGESFSEETVRAIASTFRVGESSMDRKARLLADGLCPSCGLVRDGHTQLCSWCSKRHAASVVTYRDGLRALGACSNCGEPTGKIGKWKCKSCTDRIIQGHAGRRAKWKAAGLCVECGKPPKAPGRRLCQRHADIALAAYHARKKRLREAAVSAASPAAP